MDYEDSDASFGNGFQEDYLNYADSSGITSLPIQQPVIQPIAQPIVQPIVQPVAPVVAPEVQQVQPVIQQQPLTPFAPPVVEQVAQEENTGVFGLPSVQPPPVAPPVQPAAPAGPDPKAIDALTNQILGQGLTSKWTGEGFGSAEKNAADMAKILAGIGITDIKQFGKFTQTGIQTEVRPDGQGGFIDDKGNPVDPSIVKSEYQAGEAGDTTTYTAPVGTQEVFGNKVTKQAVPNTYSERQTGNFFGGTFSGKGNTGYGVQFDSQGNPIFYTQGASSNDLAQLIKDLGPIGQIALAAATGGMSLPAQLATNAGIQLLAGGNLGDIVKGTALSYLGGQAGNLISGSSGITDLLGKTGSDIAARTTQQFVGSGGKADLGQALLGNVVGSGVNSVIGELPGLDSLSATDKNLTSNLIAAVATGTPIDQAIQNALVGKASSEARSAVAEARNAAPAPQTYEEMMAGITPKMPDQPSVDTGPSNDEILKQIGYEPEPATVSQEPQNINELLAQLEPLKEKAAPGVNVAEQQAAAERIAQEQAARERAYQEQADRDAQERQAAIQKANEEAEAAQRAHDEQVAQETKAAKERQDAIDKEAAEAKQADDARAQAKAKADQEEHDAQVAKDAQAAVERQAAIDRERAQAEADQRAYDEQIAREAQEAKDTQDAIDRANAEAEKQVVPEPTPEPKTVTELLRQIQPEPVVEPVATPVVEEPVVQPVAEEPVAPPTVSQEPATIDELLRQIQPEPVAPPVAQPVAEEPVAQPVAEEPVAQPTVTEEPANISQLLRELNPYAEPTQEGRTLPQEVPQITEEPKAQELPFNVDSILQTLSEPVVSQPVELPSPDEDFAPTVTEPAQEMTVQQEPEDLDSLLAALNLSQAPDAQPSTDLSESELDSLKLMNLISAGGEDTSTTEPSTQASDSLINQAATDTLGTETQNAEEPAVEKDKAMDEIDFSQIPGDYGSSLADELTRSITDTGNASSLFSGDGGIDIADLLANSEQYPDAYASGNLDPYNNFNPEDYKDAFASGNLGENNQGYYDEITGKFVQDPLGGLLNPLGDDVGNIDPNSKWEYSQTMPGVWVSDSGDIKDLRYLPNTEKTMTGAQIMKKAGVAAGSGGKSSTSTAKAAAKPGTSPGTNNTQMLMALMAMMAMMNNKGGGGSSASSVIPALSANRSQLPYAPTGRPGAGGQNYFSPTTYTPKAAGGGLMALAGGGMSNLGGYSDGGRLLKGPGDGVSDSIPATIGGKQPARLATGEFVVPARIVSELGNGSTEAGAKKLYAMMDRVQKARRKTKNVAADTKAHKYLPA